MEITKINLNDNRYKLIYSLLREKNEEILIELFFAKGNSYIPYNLLIQVPKNKITKTINLSEFLVQDGSNTDLILNSQSSVVRIWSILDKELFDLNEKEDGVISNLKYSNLYNYIEYKYFNDCFFEEEKANKMKQNFGKRTTQYAIKRNYEIIKTLLNKIEINLD